MRILRTDPLPNKVILKLKSYVTKMPKVAKWLVYEMV